MININTIMLFYIIAISIITFLVHFILYILSQFDRKKVQEKIMIENAAMILDKIDQIKKPIGGKKKMDNNIKNLAKYLVKKIDEAKEEILEEMNGRFDELDISQDEEEEYNDEDFEEEDELDSLFDEDEETEEEPKEMPKSLDITKRQVKADSITEADLKEEPKKKEVKEKKKKSLFGLVSDKK